MSATYDSSMASNRDKVRFLIQDTVVASAMLQDEEIDFMLIEYPNYKMAAANCADVLSSKFASAAEDRQIGNLRLRYADKSKKYADLANRLRMQASKFILPYAGGISKADKEAINDETDRVEPSFRRGQMKQALPSVDIADDDAT
jgi:hypothetical protein